MRRRIGRQSKREEIEAKIATIRFYAGASDKPGSQEHAARSIERLEAQLPKPRAARRPSGKPLERDVLKAIMQALRRDPRVATCERQQSGVFREGNRWIRVGTPGVLDIKGMLVGGRAFEIEVKRPGGAPDPRQQRRIDALRANGAVAGCATSVDEALALLP